MALKHRLGVISSLLVLSLGWAGCDSQAPRDGAQTEGVSEAATPETAVLSIGLPDPSPAPSSAFFYGEDLPQIAGAALAVELNATLAQVTNQALASFGTFENTKDGRPDLDGTQNVKVFDPRRSWGGYTLLTSLGTMFVPSDACKVNNFMDPACATNYHGAILIDMAGNVVKSWPLTGFPAKPLPGGNVVGGVLVRGQMTKLIQMDWCQNATFEWPVPVEPGYLGTAWHHDFQRAGSPVGYFAPCMNPSPRPTDGTTLLLTNHVVDKTYFDTRSVSGDLALYDDAFYEIDSAGKVLWSWHAWEHFDQMGFDAKAKEAIRTIQVPGGAPGSSDWTHMNQAARLGPNAWHDLGDLRFHPDNIIFDTRSSGILGIVARYDHPRGKWKSGDIVWRVGPNYGYGTDEMTIGDIIGPHMTHMIPRGLPGAGNILVFDNGGFSGFGAYLNGLPATWPNKLRDYSRVVEFNPLTLRVVWEYKVPVAGTSPKFFSTLISGAQRLKNGNTMITQGGTGRVFEVTRAGDIVWDYVAPFSARPFGGPGALLGPNAVYRAYRVPPSWVPVAQACPLPTGWAPVVQCN
jgi:hypothetical protein